MHKTRLQVGDTVVIRSGNSKGQSGKILSIDRVKQTAVVEGINVRKRHTKPTQANQQGGVFEKPLAMPLSKMGIKHPSKANATSKIAYNVTKSGKTRIYKSNSKEIK